MVTSRMTLATAACVLAAALAARPLAQAGPQAPAGAPGRGGAGGGPGAGGGNGQTFPAQQRPPGDPAVIARGKQLYGINCASCHGSDLRGGDMGGPNLLRAPTVLSDEHGELFIPIVHGSRQDKGMDPINLPDSDIVAVAEYVHSIVATSRGQGSPPPGPPVTLNILVGNAQAGQAYFAAKCASCHSATGDLAGIGSRISDPKALQDAWVGGSAGAGARGGGAGGGRGGGAANVPTVTVTQANGQKVEGTLVRYDDFIVVLKLPDGTERSIRRDGDTPKVEVHDPQDAHRKLLPTYTDKDIHDVTAYLVTLK